MKIIRYKNINKHTHQLLKILFIIHILLSKFICYLLFLTKTFVLILLLIELELPSFNLLFRNKIICYILINLNTSSRLCWIHLLISSVFFFHLLDFLCLSIKFYFLFSGFYFSWFLAFLLLLFWLRFWLFSLFSLQVIFDAILYFLSKRTSYN